MMAKMAKGTNPSKMASPNGRVVLVPPRNKFQTWSANAASTVPPEVVLPSEMVTIFPLDWHVLMSSALRRNTMSFYKKIAEGEQAYKKLQSRS